MRQRIFVQYSDNNSLHLRAIASDDLCFRTRAMPVILDEANDQLSGVGVPDSVQVQALHLDVPIL